MVPLENLQLLLASAGDLPRKCVFEEGALGHLLKIMGSGPMPMKEKAAMAVEFITADPDNAWAVSAYGGIPIIIELSEEGVVPVLMQLLASGSPVQEKAANCFSILTSNRDHFRCLFLQQKGLQKLLHTFQECARFITSEHILRAIYSLSYLDMSYRILSGSTPFIVQLAEHVKNGNVVLRHMSASLLANLAISDGNKRAISSCMGSLVKLMEYEKPDGMQEVGAKALLSLLAVKSNRKEFVKD